MHLRYLNVTDRQTDEQTTFRSNTRSILWKNTKITSVVEQESPSVADKLARRESMPKIAPIRRAYNVVADNTGLSSFV